jgi:outer membrane lipoprotein-sorting protein
MFKCMKKLLLCALFLLTLTATAFTQRSAIMGKWTGAFAGPDGQSMKFTMVISDDTYQIDFGMDGTPDVTGAYTADGDQVTVWDTAGENICPSDQKGVYRYAVEGDMVTFTKVTDACPGRGNEPMVLKRAN